ncbi:MAG: beta-galactosidase, partial [Lachnospiraceae bacterium]|nr:beta-galactosidase [Lachnospiraceae bacterium]
MKKNRFFSIGGQVNNSSAQSVKALERAICAIRKFDMNTIAVPLYWYQIEPEEGHFCFEQIDMVLEQAEENDLKVVFLWFGSWKNGASHYTPVWVRCDRKRFPRAKNYAGADTRILSPIGMASRDADAGAVAAVLRYIRSQDAQERVIAFQVENEPGLLGTPRDYSAEAQALFDGLLPEDMERFLQTLKQGEIYRAWEKQGFPHKGSWRECFGLIAEEIFSAYYFARYIDAVAAAGKAEYDLPMYVNVWVMETENRLPGIDYPSGGATSLALDVWKYFAPHIDRICPDIYFEDRDMYEYICGQYRRPDNELYIPESHADDQNALYLFTAIEKFNLTGIHCFAIDSTIDNNGELRPECEGYRRSVQILSSMRPLLEKYLGSGRIYAVAQYECMSSQFFDFGDYWGRV